MMENESLREPKNTAVIFLSLLVAATLIWAIVASVMASKNRKECERLTQVCDQTRVELDQVRMDAQRQIADADKLRRTCLEWTRQHQMQIQDEMRKKAEAAKAAAAKAAVKPAVKSAVKPAAKTTVKSTSKPTVKTSTTAKHH
jgi:hypothetical protein